MATEMKAMWLCTPWFGALSRKRGLILWIKALLLAVGRETGSTRRKRKPGNESEEADEQENSSEDLHLHSNRLRGCSKYFDACLSKRWEEMAEGCSREAAERVQLSLDVHANVKYYKVWISRMYSPCQKVPSIKHCLKLLRVASQITYQELVEACMCYLPADPCSEDDENRVRRFAKSPNYPSDCAADLSARLGLQLSNSE